MAKIDGRGAAFKGILWAFSIKGWIDTHPKEMKYVRYAILTIVLIILAWWWS